MTSRNISTTIKNKIAASQRYKCANKPESNLLGLENCECLLWKYEDGSFNSTGYDIDHVIEFSISQDNSESNLQALCPACHAYKTRHHSMSKKLISSEQSNSKVSKSKQDINVILQQPLPNITINKSIFSDPKKFISNTYRTTRAFDVWVDNKIVCVFSIVTDRDYNPDHDIHNKLYSNAVYVESIYWDYKYIGINNDVILKHIFDFTFNHYPHSIFFQFDLTIDNLHDLNSLIADSIISYNTFKHKTIHTTNQRNIIDYLENKTTFLTDIDNFMNTNEYSSSNYDTRVIDFFSDKYPIIHDDYKLITDNLRQDFISASKIPSDQYSCFIVNKSVFIVRNISPHKFIRKHSKKVTAQLYLKYDSSYIIPPSNNTNFEVINDNEIKIITNIDVLKKKISDPIDPKIKHSEIHVLFSKPIPIITSPNSITDDLYFKFIVNNIIHTLNEYSDDYRFNKIHTLREFVQHSQGKQSTRLDILYGFSYYENKPTNYYKGKRANFGKGPYYQNFSDMLSNIFDTINA